MNKEHYEKRLAELRVELDKAHAAICAANARFDRTKAQLRELCETWKAEQRSTKENADV